MRTTIWGILIALTGALSMFGQLGQETVDHTYAHRVIPFNLLSFTPGECQVGQVFVRKDQPFGSNLYICGNANNWVPLFGAGGGTTQTNTILNFPITGTPTDGTTLTFNAAQQAWVPATVPVWKKYTINYSDLSQSAFTKAVNLFTLAARQKLCGISIYVTTGFAATPTLTKATVSIGDSLGTATTYTASALSMTAPTGNDYNVMGSVYPGTGIVQANVAVSGALLSDLTAGSLDVVVCTVQQP